MRKTESMPDCLTAVNACHCQKILNGVGRVRAEGPQWECRCQIFLEVWPSMIHGPDEVLGVELSPMNLQKEIWWCLSLPHQITYFRYSREASQMINFRTARLCKPNSCRMTFPPALHNPKKTGRNSPNNSLQFTYLFSPIFSLQSKVGSYKL